MDMQIKSSLIKKYRNQRLWSQEQLAQATGLGLRTIQRLEADGKCSLDTLQALAAVFEVDAESLIWSNGEFQNYHHRQWGYVTFILMPILIFMLVATNSAVPMMPPILFALLIALLVVTAFVFSSMTIEVDEQEVRWFFGPGVWRKSLSLQEIDSCKKVKNPLWMGFGIHTFGTGWIYNVSGLLGVEIELKSGAQIRLGTNEPNYLVQAIMDARDSQ